MGAMLFCPMRESIAPMGRSYNGRARWVSDRECPEAPSGVESSP